MLSCWPESWGTEETNHIVRIELLICFPSVSDRKIIVPQVFRFFRDLTAEDMCADSEFIEIISNWGRVTKLSNMELERLLALIKTASGGSSAKSKCAVLPDLNA